MSDSSNKLKSLIVALAVCAAWVAASAQTPAVQSPVQWSASIPRLTKPPAAAGDNGGGSTPDLQVGAAYAPSAHFYARLLTDLPAASIADHYETQLAAAGWKSVNRQVDASLASVRFLAGTPTDPLTGMLIVIPFTEAKQTIVAVRLVVNRWPWAGRGRSGGGGANLAQPKSVRFASHNLEVPLSVTRVEMNGGGGTSNYMAYDMRLETGDSPAALMPHFEAQLPRPGWTRAARLGDRSQSLIRRDSMPDPETDSSQVWMLTSMPGTREIDFVYMTIQTWRGRK